MTLGFLRGNPVKGKTTVGVNPQDLFSIKRIEKWEGTCLQAHCSKRLTVYKIFTRLTLKG